MFNLLIRDDQSETDSNFLLVDWSVAKCVCLTTV